MLELARSRQVEVKTPRKHRHSAELGTAAYFMFDAGSIAESDSSFLQTRYFVTFQIFEDCAHRETDVPIIAVHLSDSIASLRNKAGFSVGLFGRCDEPGNEWSGNARCGKSSRQGRKELTAQYIASDSAEIDGLAQPGGGVLNVEASADGYPVKNSISDGWLNVERLQLGSQSGVTTRPAGIIVCFQTKRDTQPNSDRQIAVLRTAKNRLRKKKVRNQMVDSAVPAVSTGDLRSIKWCSWSANDRAIVRKCSARHDVVQAGLKLSLRQQCNSCGVKKDSGGIFGLGRTSSIRGT